MNEFIKSFTYGSITLTVLFGIICRNIWLSNNSELDEGKKKLPIEFTYTGFELITLYVVIWPVMSICCVEIYLCMKWNAKVGLLFLKQAGGKWVISFLLISIFYYSSVKLLGKDEDNYDISAHVYANLVM